MNTPYTAPSEGASEHAEAYVTFLWAVNTLHTSPQWGCIGTWKRFFGALNKNASFTAPSKEAEGNADVYLNVAVKFYSKAFDFVALC